MKTNGNEPCNPVLTQSSSLQNETSLGLTKREMFAMAAMQGMYNNGVMTINGSIDRSPDGIAIMAVQAADELINALNK